MLQFSSGSRLIIWSFRLFVSVQRTFLALLLVILSHCNFDFDGLGHSISKYNRRLQFGLLLMVVRMMDCHWCYKVQFITRRDMGCPLGKCKQLKVVSFSESTEWNTNCGSLPLLVLDKTPSQFFKTFLMLLFIPYPEICHVAMKLNFRSDARIRCEPIFSNLFLCCICLFVLLFLCIAMFYSIKIFKKWIQVLLETWSLRTRQRCRAISTAVW